jgi:hypothetical protein
MARREKLKGEKRGLKRTGLELKDRGKVSKIYATSIFI